MYLRIKATPGGAVSVAFALWARAGNATTLPNGEPHMTAHDIQPLTLVYLKAGCTVGSRLPEEMSLPVLSASARYPRGVKNHFIIAEILTLCYNSILKRGL